MTKARSAGDELRQRILADLDEQGLDPDSRELELLDRACSAADRIERLEVIVAEHGETVVDGNGNIRPSALLTEIRLSTHTIARCLGGIQFDAGKDAVKQRAGRASWAARSAAHPDRRGAIG